MKLKKYALFSVDRWASRAPGSRNGCSFFLRVLWSFLLNLLIAVILALDRINQNGIKII